MPRWCGMRAGSAELDFVRMDWVVVRNRMSQIGSRKDGLVGEGLEQLAPGSAFARRWICRARHLRELFPRGLTALDEVEEGETGRVQRRRLSVQQECCGWSRA